MIECNDVMNTSLAIVFSVTCNTGVIYAQRKDLFDFSTRSDLICFLFYVSFDVVIFGSLSLPAAAVGVLLCCF